MSVRVKVWFFTEKLSSLFILLLPNSYFIEDRDVCTHYVISAMNERANEN